MKVVRGEAEFDNIQAETSRNNLTFSVSLVLETRSDVSIAEKTEERGRTSRLVGLL